MRTARKSSSTKTDDSNKIPKGPYGLTCYSVLASTGDMPKASWCSSAKRNLNHPTHHVITRISSVSLASLCHSFLSQENRSNSNAQMHIISRKLISLEHRCRPSKSTRAMTANSREVLPFRWISVSNET